MNFKKYRPYPKVNLPNRKWVNNTIEKAPIWCSVDLRDGNQALESPMTLEQKVDFFKYLIKIGFKEIEIGFPAASDTEFQFTRHIIENNLIPDDVTIQVLTQSREHIINKTFEAIAGCKNAIVHLYNSTSTLQRDVVFNFSMEQTIALAVSGAKQLVELSKTCENSNISFEYSPESFTGTELDFALELLNSIIEVFNPSEKNKLIINLPATVEMSTPNVYADQIEYICENINSRENLIISLHTHNDRGTGVAASELGILAGADRIEGTLFGNGERTGNADIMTLGMNLYTQGIDPKLDFSHIDDMVEIYERMTLLPVHERHPYAGKLVFTAFSGSHQDAINKGLQSLKDKETLWEVPYLPLDPYDVGRTYDPIIRINSQSGKGGVAYVLEKHFNLVIPKVMQQHFSSIVTKVSDDKTKVLDFKELYNLFEKEYINFNVPIELLKYKEVNDEVTTLTSYIIYNGSSATIEGVGNGVVEALCDSLAKFTGKNFNVKQYSQHALEVGSKSKAITYIEIEHNGKSYFGAGISSNITKSSLFAVISALNYTFK
ncbi:MAG: 2-isopropylmalate synthase [Lachnospirales bacterium]